MGRKNKASSKTRLRASDIKDVEQGLNTLRRDIESRGTPLAEQPNDTIFTIDRAGVVGDEKNEQKCRLNKPLRIDQILQPQSGVPAISNRQKTTRGPSVAEQRIIKQKLKNSPQPNPPIKQEKSLFDAWDSTIETSTKIRLSSSSLDSKKKRARLDIPEEGASYRPSPEAHQRLIEIAAQIELDKIKRQDDLRKKVPETLRQAPAHSTVDAAIKEILEGNVAVIEEEDEEIEQEASLNVKHGNNEVALISVTKKKNIKKNEKQRKKEKRITLTKVAQNAEKAIKQHKRELNSLKSIAKEVRQEISEQLQRTRAKRKAQKQRLRQKQTFPSNIPIAINLPEEIPTSFRQIKTEGNLIKEQFAAIQQRLIIK